MSLPPIAEARHNGALRSHGAYPIRSSSIRHRSTTKDTGKEQQAAHGDGFKSGGLPGSSSESSLRSKNAPPGLAALQISPSGRRGAAQVPIVTEGSVTTDAPEAAPGRQGTSICGRLFSRKAPNLNVNNTAMKAMMSIPSHLLVGRPAEACATPTGDDDPNKMGPDIDWLSQAFSPKGKPVVKNVLKAGSPLARTGSRNSGMKQTSGRSRLAPMTDPSEGAPGVQQPAPQNQDTVPCTSSSMYDSDVPLLQVPKLGQNRLPGPVQEQKPAAMASSVTFAPSPAPVSRSASRGYGRPVERSIERPSNNITDTELEALRRASVPKEAMNRARFQNAAVARCNNVRNLMKHSNAHATGQALRGISLTYVPPPKDVEEPTGQSNFAVHLGTRALGVKDPRRASQWAANNDRNTLQVKQLK